MDSYLLAGGRRAGIAVSAKQSALVFAAFATLVAVLLSLPAFAQDTLTLAEAQRRAVTHSSQLLGRDAAATAAREMAVAAGQLPDPVLGFGIDSLPVSSGDRFSLSRDNFTQRRIGISQELTRGDKRQLRSARYEREVEKVELERAANTASIQRDTALAWFDRWYAEAMAVAIAEQIAAARLEVAGADAAWRGGRGSLADVLAARSGVATIEDRASDIERRLRNARTALARWTGDEGPSRESRLAAPPDVDTLRLPRDHFDTALANHPEIAMLDKGAEVADTDARLANANRKPDWSVQVSLGVREPAFSNFLSIGVSVPLLWDRPHRQDRELAAKLALAEQARAEREEALRAHRAEVATMLADWDTAHERRNRYERALLPLAAERIEAARAAYRGGKGSLADVLAARRAAIETRLAALQIEQDGARAWAQLSYLVPDLRAATKETK